MTYREPRDRDATPAIRGFVYQVHQSILRWLALPEGEVLRLECGEDIAQVAQALSEEEAFVLEQVHSGPGTLTLRTPKAVEALANLHDHIRANPRLPLRFRFTTVAVPGREQGSPLQFPERGIETWELVRHDRHGNRELALAGLRELLQSGRQPDAIPDELWVSYQEFVSGSTHLEFEDFVSRFEWSVGAVGLEGSERQILRTLQDDGFSAEPQEAQQHYSRLFMKVFRILASEGEKELSAAILRDCLAVELSDVEKALVRRLESQVAVLQFKVDENRSRIEQLSSKIEHQLAPGIADLRITATPRIDLQPPVLPAKLASRSNQVADLARHLDQAVWLHLMGTAGSGKTTLANLLCLSRPWPIVWVSLRDLDPSGASTAVVAALSLIVKPDAGETVRNRIRRLAEQEPEEFVLVLDDLPRLSPGDEMTVLLTILAEEAAEVPLKIISTGHHRLPRETRESTSFNLEDVTVPLLNEEDVLELLEVYGCPDSLQSEEFAATLNALSRKHPLLAVANVRYCEKVGWKIGFDALLALATGESLADLDEEVLERTLNTTEADSRQLLYRMSLSTRPITLDSVTALAKVEPELSGPAEHLHSMVGLWVQKEAGGAYSAIQLVDRIGRQNLNRETARSCHRVLADLIIARGRLNQHDAFVTIAHLTSGGENLRAVSLLVESLIALRDALPIEPEALGEAPDDGGLASLWADMPLPEDVPLAFRVWLRSVQVQVYDRLGRDSEYVEQRLLSLIAECGDEEAWAVVVAAMHASLPLAESDFWAAMELSVMAIELAVDARLPSGEPFPWPEPAPPEFLFWLISGAIRTHEQLVAWIDAFGDLSETSRKRALSIDVADDAAVILANQLWLEQEGKPTGDQDWQALIAVYDNAAGRAAQIGASTLSAALVRTAAIIRCDHLDEAEIAKRKVLEALQVCEDTPPARMLLAEAKGIVELKLGEVSAAAASLDSALALAPPGMPGASADVLYRAARTMARAKDFVAAHQHLSDAIEIHRREGTGPKALACLYGDAMVAAFLADDYEATFDWAEACLFELLSVDASTDFAKSLDVKVAHAIGYISAQPAVEGELTLENGDPYPVPWVGMMFHEDPGLLDLFQPASRAMTMSGIARFGSRLGISDRPAEWAKKALNEPGAETVPGILFLVGRILIIERIEAGDCVTAAEIADRYSAIDVAVQGELEDVHLPHADLEGILSATASERQDLVTSWSLAAGLLPAILLVAQAILDQPESMEDRLTSMADAFSKARIRYADGSAWQKASDLLTRAAKSSEGASEISALADKLEPDTLRASGYLLVTMHPDCPLQAAAGYHASVAAAVLKHADPLTEKAMADFLERYWSKQLQESRFAFSGPSLVERSLAEAEKAAPAERARLILNAILSGLGISRASLPTKIKAWLAGE